MDEYDQFLNHVEKNEKAKEAFGNLGMLYASLYHAIVAKGVPEPAAGQMVCAFIVANSDPSA